MESLAAYSAAVWSGTAGAWLRFGAWLLAGYLSGLLAAWLWETAPRTLPARVRAFADAASLRGARGAVRWTVTAGILRLGGAASFRAVPGVVAHPVWAAFLGGVFVLLVASVTLLLYRLIRTALHVFGGRLVARTTSSVDDQFIALLDRTAGIVLAFVALTVVLGNFHIEITGLLATAGVASLAVAFAAQETLSNLIAGIVLMVDRPFKTGDRIELADGKIGDVIDVGLRSTHVMSFDNTVIAIPNSEIAKGRIVNFSAPTPHMKIRATIGVGYGSDMRLVKRILMEILEGHPEILKDPPPSVFFTGFGESSLDLLYVGWVSDYREQFRIRDEINMAIKDRFEAEGVEIPFPQRDVHVRSGPPNLSARPGT